MKKRTLTPKEKNERVKRERDPIPWRYCLLTLVCGLILVAGFFWAARQHFSAMDLGIKNAKLREQRQNLKDEAERLYLAKQHLLSPEQIKKAAKKLGLQDFAAQSIQVITATKEPKDEKTASEFPKQVNIAKDKEGKSENLNKTETPKTEVKTKDGKPKSQASAATETRARIAKN